MTCRERGGAVETGLSDRNLSVIIPSYLEGSSLKTLLPLVKSAAQALTSSYEVLVIDTQAAMDDTPSVCREFDVFYVPRRGGNQYGDAIRTGIENAKGEYILCMDGDGSHDPTYFGAMWRERADNDIVVGSRYVAGGKTANPKLLIWMSYVLNFTFRVAFSLPVKDVTNSFRLYRRSILSELKLESSDFDILEEILVKAITLRPTLRIKEVPITFAKRQAGESKRRLLMFVAGYVNTLRKLQRFRANAKRDMQMTTG